MKRFATLLGIMMALTNTADAGSISDRLKAPARTQAAVASSASVTVNCAAGETIQGALAANTAEPYLILTVNGQCSGTVHIIRNNVTIKGSSPTSYGARLNGTFQLLSGARNVVIEGFAIRDTAYGIFGITLDDRASLKVDRVSISQAAYEILATQNSSVSIDNASIRSATAGVLAMGNSIANVTSSTIIADGQAAGPDADGIIGGALVAIDRSEMSVRYSRLIHTAATNPAWPRLAIQLSQGAKLSAVANAEITGDILATEHSSAFLRGGVLKGRLTLEDMSFAVLANGTQHQGPIISESLSLVKFAPDVGAITGNVICRTSGRIHGQTAGLNIVGCTLL